MIRLSKSSITHKDIGSVVKVLQKEYLGMGENVKIFEDKLKLFFKRSVVCVSSGTSALQLALQAIGVKKNDEVIVPSLTYVSTFQAIKACNAIPIAVDINLKDLNFSLDDIKKKISKKTKCIIPVHYAGSAGNLSSLLDFAKKNKIRIIEDAAHSFGTIYKKNLIGSFGDISCFSFDGIKNITAGEGGCVVTKDKKVINYIKDSRVLGIKNESKKRYKNEKGTYPKVEIQGWRYHMSNIMAALGSSQLDRIKKISKVRQSLATYYQKKLENNPKIILLDHDYRFVVPHIFVIRLKNFNEKNRNNVMKQLKNKKIETGFHWYPNHLLKYFASNKKISLKNTEIAFNEIITLPLHLDLKKKDVDYIIYSLNMVLRKFN
ncbi:DegT/DnrJ/EryC1/StrS family aminotransferase [Pelagibacteraceae bacterium]|jgi:dTDP-4-amino-4,6-dideoxygalactose transaminase|nr:DegT/DnrJ/EryC1/StrS family aminotransferase [Pelagibacteraceae bacterium]